MTQQPPNADRLIVAETIRACREVVAALRHTGRRIALVPTMGALHEGHTSLIDRARDAGYTVVVSIFVNPTQFGPGEDLDAYPRSLDADLATCRAHDVTVAFVPTVAEMYGDNPQITVHVGDLAARLCGAHRPGHFDGVATVVAKLLNIVTPDAAYFGEKDYQQLKIIERIVSDLDFPVAVVGCSTVREPDGLARSSRNAYLDASQRMQACCLYRAMQAAVRDVRAGLTDAHTLVRNIRREIEAAGPAAIDYIEIVHADTLEPVHRVSGRCRICIAVRIGSCRLIDNVAVDSAGVTT